MSLLSTMDTLFRDRDSLYQAAIEGRELGKLSCRLLAIFILSSGLYGAAMGSFRWIHPQFFFSDFRPSGSEDEAAVKKVAGANMEAKKIFTREKDLSNLADSEIRFNVSRPTEPYKVVSVGEEAGYGMIELAPDSVLEEPNTWRLPLLVALKTPSLFVLSLVVCSLALYMLNLAFGVGLHFVPTMVLMFFGLAATGVMLGVFIPIVGLFAVVTENYHFMKLLHLSVFTVAGLFGVKVLYEGLVKSAPEGANLGKVKALMLSWLVLYGIVGGQLAWTLKPFLGTPYLPATPPFRIESGNIYVTCFQSLAKLMN